MLLVIVVSNQYKKATGLNCCDTVVIELRALFEKQMFLAAPALL